MNNEGIMKKHLSQKKAGQTVKDEYYTKYDEVKHIFEDLVDTEQFRGKTVYSPCDTGDSAFTRWFNEHYDEYGLRHYMNTSDDMFTHRDLFEKSDIIVTNPPFSAKSLRPMIELIRDLGKKFFLFASGTGLHKYWDWTGDWFLTTNVVYRGHRFMFETADRGDFNVMSSIYWYNIEVDPLKEKAAIKFKNTSKDDITLTAVTRDRGEVLAVDYVRDYPFDYDGWCLTPMTICVHNNVFREQFEYSICGGKISFSDGQPRYVRLFTRRKPEYVGQKFTTI